jgi:GT2 family glycosyltransferase
LHFKIHLVEKIFMNKIGVITVTYNSSTVISEFLCSLLAQEAVNFHLYAVDSHSSDDTLSKISSLHSEKITLLAQNENVGFAKGNNIGIAQAINDGCDGLLLINNDTVFEKDFITKLLELNKSTPEVILAPKIYYPDKQTIWCAGGGFKPHHAWAAYHRGENEVDNGQYDSDCNCDFVPMCCVLIPLEAWSKVGELDEKYFLYSEDADWFYRARQIGVKLRYCFEATLIHKVSSLTGGAKSRTGAWYGARNRIYFLRKHFSGWVRYKFLAVYCGGMLVKLILRQYSFKEFGWRIKGMLQGFKL